MNTKRIKDVGLVYLALATFFGGVICITIFHASKFTPINYDIIKEFLKYTWFYVIINFILSLFIGLSLIFNKQKYGNQFMKYIIIMSGLFILVDAPPIVNTVFRFFINKSIIFPSTIFLFGIHLVLFVLLLLNMKERDVTN